MAAPVISVGVFDTNDTTIALTGDSSTLIKYHSTAHAVMAATPQGGASINEDSYIIRNGSRTKYGSICDFENVENNVFTFSAEDENGNVGTATVTAKMINYVRLTCNMTNSKPDTDGDMTLSCTGNYFNGSFGDKANSLTVKYSYTGSDGSSDSGSMSVTKSGNTYSARVNLSGLDYHATYSFVITATDKLETATSRENAVTSLPIFHWGADDFTFEVPVAFNGSGITLHKGDLRLKGDKNYGNALYFGDGSYCYIKEATDDNMTIKASDLALNADMISLNAGDITINGGTVGYGTWTPRFSSSSAVDYYDVQEGWYQKLGTVVTIGWQLDAEINSGYEDTTLKIRGVPFTPSLNAFGGGVAFNIYAKSDFIFEGWCVDTSGYITARLQPCEKASAENLQIGSTCYYPEGGGTLTLAGTICYMTDE